MNSVRAWGLARRNEAANLRKELLQMENRLRELEAQALFARWLFDNREAVAELRCIDSLQLRLDPILATPELPKVLSAASPLDEEHAK